VQRDAGEQIAERLLQREREHGGEDGAAGQERDHVDVERGVNRRREQQEIERDGHDAAQQLRRGHVAPPRDRHVENENIDQTNSEENQRRIRRELERGIKVGAVDHQRVSSRVPERPVRGEKNGRQHRGKHEAFERAPSHSSRSRRRAWLISMMSLMPMSRCTSPNPDTNPRTNGFAAISVIAALLWRSGLSVQSRVHGTTRKNRPASRQYSAKNSATDMQTRF
jgi:hypothetical protein